MALADMAIGADAAIKQILLQRMQAQQYADTLKQRDFENRRQVAADARAQQQLDLQAESTRLLRERQQAEADGLKQQRTYAEATALGDQLPAGTFLPEDDAAVATMQQGGRGGLLTAQDAGMGTAFQGPMPTGETPQSVANNRPKGYLKTASAKQQQDAATRQDRLDDNKRQDARDAELARHDRAMEGTAAAAAQNKANPNDARGDRSYQYHMSQVDKIGNPIADRLTRLQRLKESIAAGSAIADSVTAPELVTAIAGGQGSGVRITQAELNAVIGARGTVDTLKQGIQRMATGESLTPEQRRQIGALADVVAAREAKRAAAVDAARVALMGSNDPMEHRKIYTDMQAALSSAGQPASGSGGMVEMVAPDGRALKVPAEKVADLEARGARRR